MAGWERDLLGIVQEIKNETHQVLSAFKTQSDH